MAATDIPDDPNILLTRLQQCIQKLADHTQPGQSGLQNQNSDSATYIIQNDQSVAPFDDET